MKTTLLGAWERAGQSALYPDFTPYVAKYADNGRAKTKRELDRYFAEYRRRANLYRIKRRLQMLVTNLDYSDYVGRIAIGKVFAGEVSEGQRVTVIDKEGLHTQQKVMQIHQFYGLGRKRASTVAECACPEINDISPK